MGVGGSLAPFIFFFFIYTAPASATSCLRAPRLSRRWPPAREGEHGARGRVPPVPIFLRQADRAPGCIELRCGFLYSYVDMLNGRQYVGCMQEVFAAEVELEAMLEPGGFGGVKIPARPHPQCQFSVERAYEGEGPAYECVNPRFFDCTDQGPEGLRAFDLRNALASER